MIRQATAGTGKRLSLELGRQVAVRGLRRCRPRLARSRAWSMPSGSTRARSAAPARACWCRRASRRACWPSCARAWRRCAWAIRWTRPSTSARSSRPCSSSGSAAGRAGCRRGRDDVAAHVGLPHRRLFLPADAVHRRGAGLDHGPGGDLRPGAGGDDLPHQAEAVALANNTPYGLAASVWSENINLALDVARAHQGRHGLDQLAPTSSTPPPASAAIARAASAARAAREGLYEYLREPGRLLRRQTGSVVADDTTAHGELWSESPTLAARAWPIARTVTPAATAMRPALELLELTAYPPIDRTPKLYIGGKQARPDSGYSRVVQRARWPASSARSARATARTSATP